MILQRSRLPFSSGIRLSLGGTLPVILAIAAASCSPAVLGTATVWSGDVNASTVGGVQGTVAVASQFDQTQASMSMRFGQPDSTYEWRMAHGDCSSEGKIVGGRAAYPALMADSTGAAAAMAYLPGAMTSGGNYAVRILQEAGGGTEEVLACGVLNQTK